MKKMNFTSHLSRLSLLLVMLFASVASLSAQALCPEKLPLPLTAPAACTAVLGLGDLGGPVSFTVKKPGSPASAAVTTWTFTKADIGTEFEVMSTYAGGEMCYTRVTVIDNLPPVAPADFTTTIWCTDLDANGKVPAPGTTAPMSKVKMKQSNAARNVINTRDATFVVTDCSDYFQYYTDTYGPVTSCPVAPYIAQTVTRTWTFKDKWGNQTAPDLIETIDVISAPIKIRGIGGAVIVMGEGNGGTPAAPVALDDINLFDCKANASASAPFIDWNLNDVFDAGEAVVYGQSYCGRVVNINSNPDMPLCGGKMLSHVYKVDNCGVFEYFSQVVNILDRTSPTVSVAYEDFLRTPEEICEDIMGGTMRVTKIVYKTVKENVSATVNGVNSGATPPPATQADLDALPIAGAIKVSPLMSVATCGVVDVKLNLSATDPSCTNGKVTFFGNPGSPFKFMGMPIATVDGGTSIMITGTFTSPTPPPVVTPEDITDFIYIKDACGNVTKIKVTIVIIDNVSPNAYCEDKQVSLTNNKGAVVTPRVFSSGKQDNCTDEVNLKQYIRRTTPANNGCWVEQLVLDCNDKNIKVDILTIDECNNYNICCVNASVVDKVAPTCLNPADKSLICTDPKIASIANEFAANPDIYSNCAPVNVTSAITGGVDNCGTGTFTKTWTIKFTNDASPNEQSITCSQRIRVTPVRGYRVRPMLDSTYTCSGYEYNEERERGWALSRVSLVDSTGNPTCSAPVVEVEKWEYSNSQFCKIIRIRYTFVDKCGRYCSLPLSASNYVNWDDASGKAGYLEPSAGVFQADRRGTLCEGSNYGLLFGYERYIYINDTKAPTPNPVAVGPFCVGDACTYNFSTTLTARDSCVNGNVISVTSSGLAYNWTLTGPGLPAAGISGNTATVSRDGLVRGTYTVNWSVADYCGNRSFSRFTFDVRDCKDPWILVHTKVLELGYDTRTNTAMGEVCYDDVKNNVGDNCTTDKELLHKNARLQRVVGNAAVYPAGPLACIMFGCADAGKDIELRVWTQDEAGNSNFVITKITVQDNKGLCGPNPLASIRGTLRTENNQAVNNVNVTASINGTSVGTGATNTTGEFALTAPLDQNVQVKAVKIATEDKYAGVTTFDIARISKHVLDIEKLGSPYSIISADVDKNNEVDASDMLHIRNFILRKTSSLPGGVWRFIDKSYKFTNPANPFGEDFPEVVNLTKVPAAAQANFVATKLGDVNTTYTSALTGVEVRSNKALTLLAEDMQLVAGNEYTVAITSDEFNAAAFQGTFSLNGATVKSVKAGDLANYNDGNIGIFANDITTSWNGSAALNANVMTITLVANKNAKLSEVLSVGSSLTPAVANDANGVEMNVKLKFTSGKVSGGEFALYQNRPNPVAVETTIGFNLPTESSAKLTVYNVEGKVVMMRKGDFKAGYNEININKSELNASGVMYYRLETPEHTATKKMIIIE